VQVIPQTLSEVFVRAEREGTSTSALADRIAEERIRAARQIRAARGTRELAPARALAG
jgi:hypothetical protein